MCTEHALSMHHASLARLRYKGFRVTFASDALAPSFACAGGGGLPGSRGCYKAKFSVPAGDNFTAVRTPPDLVAGCVARCGMKRDPRRRVSAARGNEHVRFRGLQVRIPFDLFSDKWSSATGEQTATCAQAWPVPHRHRDSPASAPGLEAPCVCQETDVCPTAEKLSKIQSIELWAEGVNGKVQLAYTCSRLSPRLDQDWPPYLAGALGGAKDLC